MIFRRRKDEGPTDTGLLKEVAELCERNRANRDPELERQILRLRHQAGILRVGRADHKPKDPSPAFDRLPNGSAPPELAASELTPELLRAAILRDGCLLVRGLVSREDAEGLIAGIDAAVEARRSATNGWTGDGLYEEFAPDPPFILRERGWVDDSGGLWAADSPRLIFDMLDTLERAGLREVIEGYLGEPPAISVNKAVLRKIDPDAGSAWHQDGAFLGPVRALNVWLSLSRCGDVAPGLDLVPKRLDHIVPTGTDDAIFDWSVAPKVATEAAGETPIARPIFEPGDALLFDELFLHATAADPSMPNSRYAVESWFFGPSAFPPDYVPVAF
jgi:hypothetical protein